MRSSLRESRRIVATVATVALCRFVVPNAALWAVEPSWVDRYNGPASESDSGQSALVIDDALYVAGSAAVADGSGAFIGRALVARHDLLIGTRQWTLLHGADEIPAASYYCQGIAAAPGGVYVGCSRDFDQFAVLRVTSEGQVLWMRSVPSNGNFPSFRALVASADGHAVVAGVGPGDVASVARFDPSGDLVDDWTYSGPAGVTYPAALAVGDDGAVYLAGSTLVPGAGDEASLIRLSPGGTVDWERFFGAPGELRYDYFTSVAHRTGRLFAAGTANGNAPEGTRALLVALEPNGDILWESSWDGAESLQDNFASVAPTADGGAVAAGNTQLAPIDTDALVVRYDASGVAAWSHVISGATGLIQALTSVAVAPDGSCAAAGFDETSPFSTRALVARVDAQGVDLGSGLYAGPLGGGSKAYSVAFDAQGNAYVTGGSFASGTHEDVATMRFDGVSFLFGGSFESGDLGGWIAEPNVD